MLKRFKFFVIVAVDFFVVYVKLLIQRVGLHLKIPVLAVDPYFEGL